MQKVIKRDQIQDYSGFINQSVIDYIAEGLIETYESFEGFDIIAFDWYDLENAEEAPSQILIYQDDEDLFFLCEDDASLDAANLFFAPATTNESCMYAFFRNLMKGSTRYLEGLETRVSNLEDAIEVGNTTAAHEQLIDLRYEAMRAGRFFEQLQVLFDEICDNDNKFMSETALDYFGSLFNRSVRLVSQAKSVRDYISTVREAYKSQIALEQSNLMRVFTMVTSIFLPLTLIVGWYGMNVRMPETEWAYGYPFVAGLCVIVIIVWFIIARTRKWFK